MLKNVNELQPKSTFSALIYGPTGIGKTTAAISAPAPVALVDFDKGHSRVGVEFLVNAQVEDIETWEGYGKAVEMCTGYKCATLVIDTVSKLLDMITAYVIKEGNYGTTKLGTLPIQAYGAIKREFSGFIKGIKDGGMNIIFVAQEVETTTKNFRGQDIRYHQPACGSDKNRTELLQDLDMVFYMMKDGDATKITANPTELYYGKNTCGLDKYVEVPRATDFSENTLFEQIQQQYVSRQQSNLDKAPYFMQLKEMYKAVDSIDGAERANNALAYFKSKADWIADAKAKVSKRLQDKAAALQLTFNAEKKCYE